MHKLQRCYLTGKDVDDFNPEEYGIVEKTNFLRIDCCSKESLDSQCNALCEDAGINDWGVLMGACQHTLRQDSGQALLNFDLSFVNHWKGYELLDVDFMCQ